MKILLVTFDKEMENKVRQLLKDHQIITAKNGEEALLLNLGEDIDAIIYDALAGGIAEDDINRLYDEGFKNVPYIILMDDLFPIDPSNIKPKNKKILSREVEVEKLPEILKEISEKGGKIEEEAPTKEEIVEETKPAEEVYAQAQPKEEETSWEEMFAGVSTVKPETETKEEQKEEKTGPETVTVAETLQEQPKEETVSAPVEAAPSEKAPAPAEVSLKKKCLLVSFDMPLVEKIEKLIGTDCDLAIARSAKQALQKYGKELFDVIIFDTISGVFAEKGIKDLYEKGNYKDSLYVLLLDEMFPIDVEKLPVKNLRTIKRESELDLLPEIIENAPHITLEQALSQAVQEVETTPTVAVEQPPVETKEEKVETPPTVVETLPPVEEIAKEETPKVEEIKEIPTKVEEVTAPPRVEKTVTPPPTVSQPQVSVQISEEQITKIVEQKINEKIIPLIEELIRSKLSDLYIKTLARELIEEEIDSETIKETIREIAEPLVRETLESLLAE